MKNKRKELLNKALSTYRGPCNKHKPKQLGYLAWHDWAKKQGKKQTQCNKCGRWFFKSEM